MKMLLLAAVLLFVYCINDASTAVIDEQAYSKSIDNYGVKKTLKSSQIRVETNGRGYVCSLCSQVVSATKDLIVDHESEIDEVLEQVCYKLFNKYPSEEAACEALIKQELPYILNLIKKGVEPTQICSNLGLCR